VPGSNALPDGPEADIEEQRRPVDRDEGGEIDARRVSRDPEVPEADALEQAQEVPLPDEEDA
jgi:hypothetical protein